MKVIGWRGRVGTNRGRVDDDKVRCWLALEAQRQRLRGGSTAVLDEEVDVLAAAREAEVGGA